MEHRFHELAPAVPREKLGCLELWHLYRIIATRHSYDFCGFFVADSNGTERKHMLIRRKQIRARMPGFITCNVEYLHHAIDSNRDVAQSK
jgi:hypothetical protein